MTLRRFWFEFEFAVGASAPLGTRLGCGVTAQDVDEARQLVFERVFKGLAKPRIARVLEDVDVSSLDASHVLPNMGNALVRGVWFPLGYV